MTDNLPDTVSPFPILAYGPGWWAVDKPAGISVHNDPGNDILSRMAAWLGTQRLHAIHRLDQGTSGVLLVADGTQVQPLSAAFAQRHTIKTYLALVHGTVSSGTEPNGWGRWQWPLGKGSAGRRDPIGRGAKQPAETRFRVAHVGRRYSLLICRPMTGRTHQIRRHACRAGCAILGDDRYGTPRSVRALNRLYGWDRLGLHAQAVTLPLPGRPTPVTLVSLGMPENMRRLLDENG